MVVPQPAGPQPKTGSKADGQRPVANAEVHASLAQQHTDAVAALVVEGGGGMEAEVVVHVRGDGCTLDDGTPLAGSVVERIAPSAFIRALIHDTEGRPVNASGRQRHPTSRQQRVVKERDRVCRDCGRPISCTMTMSLNTSCPDTRSSRSLSSAAPPATVAGMPLRHPQGRPVNSYREGGGQSSRRTRRGQRGRQGGLGGTGSR